MLQNLWICRGEGTDPYENLALERHLLERVEAGACVLYLWQNENTVVIGRNQNPWAECRTALLAEEGGHLARRLSGGGAVFHDLGNLNFTFLVQKPDYDVDRQTQVLLRACRSLGVPAERSGRNDLLAQGRKFSGHAFYAHEGRCYHHGTLLVAADLERMGRYLRPSAAKLRSKGVPSVRARVANLREFLPGLGVEDMAEQLEQAFSAVYGLEARPLPLEALDRARLEELAAVLGNQYMEALLEGQALPVEETWFTLPEQVDTEPFPVPQTGPLLMGEAPGLTGGDSGRAFDPAGLLYGGGGAFE